MMISLFQDAQPGLIFPNHLFGWLGWFFLAALLVYGIRRWWEPLDGLRERWWVFALLFIAAPLLAGSMGVRLPGQMLPMPDTPLEVAPPSLIFLAALPWVLAAGYLGPLPAVILGVMEGLVLAVLQTHSPFTPVELGLLALLFSAAVRQNFRTLPYQILRHPLGAAVVVILAYIPLLMISTLFATNGTLVVRLDYAFSQVWLFLAARSGELLIAGIIAEMLYLAWPEWWGRKRPLVPSPAESSMEARFSYGMIPLVLVLVLTLVVGDWLVAGNAARRLIQERLSSSAKVAAESLPYFLETGQNLILTLSTPDLMELPGAQVPDTLAARLRSVPYFRQLYLFDGSGKPVSGHPVRDINLLGLTMEEQNGVALALKGVSTQVYISKSLVDDTSAQISFLAAVRNGQGNVVGVLLGRTDLNTNPFTQPAIQALKGISDLSGEGMILDEKGDILYHPVSSQVMKRYQGKQPAGPSFYDETSPTNTRQFVYYQPVAGRPWAVVLTVPARLAQQISLDIALPLLGMLLVILLVGFIFLRFSLRAVTSSLHGLSQEATLISQGQLDHQLRTKGVDEVGRLSLAFEQMRVGLKSRLEELNSLLRVSQGVASSLDINESVRPILDAALLEDACSARLALAPDVTLDTAEKPGLVAFGSGPEAQLYAGFDQQLFDLVQQQDLLSLPNVSRSRRLQFETNATHPGALLALAVNHESRYYGVLWVAYDHPRNFSEEEIRFLTTLSGEAALAAASARLYATAEVGRQRMEAVLSSTPEPVLVMDEQERLLLLNPAAVQVSGLIRSAIEGQPIRNVIGPQELVQLLTAPLTERITSREIELGNGRIYYVSISPVLAEGRPVGRVCILRDITHFKELEQLKSDFVSTVSHDLRSPLTLMRGYATMLQMVGDLNEQQKAYVRKIVTGVDNMTRLVNNLLDLGRIDAGIGLQIELVSINAIAEDVINSLQLQAVQKDIHLAQETTGTNNHLVIEADKALIQQALYNLVENAIKYTGVGGQVKIRLEGRANTALIEVQDTGIGIAPLDLPHLFEKFYRSGRREAYQQRGTGLGLAIVKSIAERHGGRVWVDSQLGKGSVFSIEIPCEQPSRPAKNNEKNA